MARRCGRPIRARRCWCRKGLEAGRAIGHTQPAARHRVQREVLPKNVGVGRIAIGDRVVGLCKGDSQMCARRARERFLCSSGGRDHRPLRAARWAAGIATYAPDETALDRKSRSTAQRHEQTTAFHEVLDLRKALQADSACDVVGFGGRTVTGSLRSLLVRHRTPLLRDAVDLLGKLQVHVP